MVRAMVRTMIRTMVRTMVRTMIRTMIRTMVRTMVRTMGKEFVQCSYNALLKFVQYCTKFFAIVRTTWPLYELFAIFKCVRDRRFLE